MYKIASENKQRRESSIAVRDLADGEEIQSPEERRKSLVAALKAIEAGIVALPKNHPRRAALGAKKFDLQTQINAIRPKARAAHAATLPECFMDAARDYLTPAQFHILMNQASRLNRERAGEAVEQANNSKGE